MADITHTGDEGTLILKTVKEDGVVVDISTATSLLYVFTGPDDARTTLVPTFVTDGSDGALTGTSLASTWTVAGRWKEQVQIVMPTGSWSTIAETRIVEDKL